jgi:hypothetical protein
MKKTDWIDVIGKNRSSLCKRSGTVEQSSTEKEKS